MFVDLFSQHILPIFKPKLWWSVTTDKPCEYEDVDGFLSRISKFCLFFSNVSDHLFFFLGGQ